MRRAFALVGLAVVVVSAGSVAAAVTLPAVPAPTVVDVVPSDEAWYSVSPLCSLPTGCISLPIGTPDVYPAGTLHVAETLGTEAARTYLALPYNYLPDGATVTGGRLVVPLDTSATDGSIDPGSGGIQICTTQVTVTSVEGAGTDLPAADCSTKVDATFVGSPATELDADLTPLAARLAETNTSLVLMPSGTGSSTWHVVFSAHSRANPATAPAQITVSYTDASAATAAPSTAAASASAPAAAAHASAPRPPARTAASVPAPVGAAPAEPAGGALAEPPATVATQAAAPAPEVAQQPAVPAPAQLTPASNQAAAPRGFSYPEILVLPLVLIAGFIALGRQLTRPLPMDDAP